MRIQFEPSTKILSLLGAQKISSVEVLQHYIDQIEQHDDGINAIVARDFDRALDRAAAADKERRSAPRSKLRPLLGLPMTVKESFDVKGLPTTWGVERYRHNIADSNADAVNRLTEAGAIIFAKTNVPTALADCQTYNPLFGTTNNPWDIERTCGGSSGGSAAALAAGFTSLELGSDLAGSLRTPAHFCGVLAHKPSYGIVPQSGHSLRSGGAEPDLSVVGPMARSVADLELAMRVLAGPGRLDTTAWRLELPAARASQLKDFRVALLPHSGTCEVDHEIEQVILQLAEDIRRAGARVDLDAAWPIDLEQCRQDFMIMMRAVGSRYSSVEELKRLADDRLNVREDDQSYKAAIRRAAGLSHHDWLSLHDRRARYRTEWRRFFEGYDVVLCPVHSSPAFPHDTASLRENRTIRLNGHPQDYNNSLYWTAIASLNYLPATVRPVSLVRGLPVGVQIIGPYLEDLTTLRFADLLTEICQSVRYPLDDGPSGSRNTSGGPPVNADAGPGSEQASADQRPPTNSRKHS